MLGWKNAINQSESFLENRKKRDYDEEWRKCMCFFVVLVCNHIVSNHSNVISKVYWEMYDAAVCIQCIHVQWIHLRFPFLNSERINIPALALLYCCRSNSNVAYVFQNDPHHIFKIHSTPNSEVNVVFVVIFARSLLALNFWQVSGVWALVWYCELWIH